MIDYYTGTPGSGKSFHLAKRIYYALQNGVNVISNVNIDISKIPLKHKKPLGYFIYVPNAQLLNNSYKNYTHEFSYLNGLYNFAVLYHKVNSRGQIIEHQTLFIVDECQEVFNSRAWNRKDRLAWCQFFRMHRHYGYDCILVSQDDKCIDKQIRSILQTQVLHRKISNYKLLGKILSFPFRGNLFICIESMYGMKKSDARLKSYYLFGSSKFFNIYDSYELLYQSESSSEAKSLTSDKAAPTTSF